MGFKQKNYRKFVATAATATLVASAVAPLASAASFTDVAPQYKEAIDFVVSKGANGLTESTFGVSDNIKRVDAAVLLVKVLGLDIDAAKASGFTDVPDRAVKYINALRETGITTGKTETSFDPHALITRGELAIWIQRAFELQGSGDVTFTDVNSRYTEAVSALVDYKITNGINETQFGTDNNAKRGDYAIFLMRAANAEEVAPTVKNIEVLDDTTLSVTLSNEKVEKVTLEKALVPNEKTEVEFTIDGVEYKETVVYEVVAPAIESVSAIDASQLQVTFTTEVDKTTAETTANYKVTNNTVTKAEVQEDGKTVVLTVKTPYVKATTTSITIDNVKIKDSKDKFPLYAGVVSIHDTLAAQIAKVEGNTNSDVLKAVTINYTEPVKAGAVIKIDGTKVAVTKAGVSQVIPVALDATKEHTVEIVNLTDTANNVTPVATFKFTANKDVTLPEVKELTALNDNQFVVEFNKKVDSSTVSVADFKIVKSTDLSEVTLANVEAQAGDQTGTKFVVTTGLTKADYEKVSSVALTIAIQDKAFKDILGNDSVATTKSVTLTKDTVAPVLETVAFEKDNNGQVTKVTFTYDEEVVVTGDLASIEVVQDNGVLVSGLFTKATVVDGKTVELTVKAGVKAGVYSVSLPKGFVVDKALAANQSAAVSKIVDFGKEESETTFDIKTAEVTAKNVITVTFPGKVVGGAFEGSATSVDRYSLNGKPLPEGTKIVLNSNQNQAIITLPAESVEKTDDVAVFQVTGVKLLTGEVNKLYTKTVTITDNVAPVLTSATLASYKADTNTSVFTLTFSEDMATVAGDVSDELKLLVDGTAVELTTATATNVDGYATKVNVAISGVAIDTAKAIEFETLSVTSADLKDKAADNVLKGEAKVTVTK